MASATAKGPTPTLAAPATRVSSRRQVKRPRRLDLRQRQPLRGGFPGWQAAWPRRSHLRERRPLRGRVSGGPVRRSGGSEFAQRSPLRGRDPRTDAIVTRGQMQSADLPHSTAGRTYRMRPIGAPLGSARVNATAAGVTNVALAGGPRIANYRPNNQERAGNTGANADRQTD